MVFHHNADREQRVETAVEPTTQSRGCELATQQNQGKESNQQYESGERSSLFQPATQIRGKEHQCGTLLLILSSSSISTREFVATIAGAITIPTKARAIKRSCTICLRCGVQSLSRMSRSSTRFNRAFSSPKAAGAAPEDLL